MEALINIKAVNMDDEELSVDSIVEALSKVRAGLIECVGIKGSDGELSGFSLRINRALASKDLFIFSQQLNLKCAYQFDNSRLGVAVGASIFDDCEDFDIEKFVLVDGNTLSNV